VLAELGLRRGQLRLGGLRLQPLVAGVEFGEHLAGTHVVPGVDEATHEVSADAERQGGFLPGVDFPGECGGHCCLGGAGLHDENRLRRLDCRVAAIAAADQQ